MKVDKAVCTNDTLEDITRAIKYEAIFTTLVENKILAIKRECEEKKKAKKQKRRSFGRILFGRRIFGGGASGSGISSSGKRPSEESIIRRKNAILVALGQIQKQPVKGIDEIKPQRDSIVSEVQVSDKSLSIRFKEPDIESGIEDATDSLRKVFLSRPDSQCDDSLDSNGDESIASRGARDLVVEVLTHRDGYPYDDSDGDKDSVVLSVIEKQPPDISSLGSYRVGGDNTSTLADESLTSVKDSSESLSFPSSRCTISAAFGTAISLEKERHRLRVLEAKSISAQCSPILPRQKLRVHTVQTQTHGKPLRQVSYVDEICRNGIGNDGDGKIIFRAGKNGNTTVGDKMKIFSRQTTSDDSANLTLSTLLNEQDATFVLPERKCKSTSILVVTDKNNKKAINRLDSNSIVSYQSNPIGRGLISSFNQLTTPSNGLPVITTTVTSYPNAKTSSQVIYSQQSQSIIKSSKECLKEQKLVHPSTASTSFITKTIHQQQQKAVGAIISTPSVPCDTNTKLQRITSTSTGSSGEGPTGCCTPKSIVKEKDKRPKPPNWEVGQSGSDDEYRKRKRKYKRHHRCSDPILVYPSTTGLQHCILSMPPNQPIEFHYDDDFVYDVALQVENDQNSDLQAIVPNHRTHRHRHHRHKKRHRHKKPKILVHDLDTQSVKVIDPDDLPQRARWTIIATACLLLLMCLMLVGITLRMAPIIDDMVRQENERLMQESLNRAKLTKNMTEAASLSANEEIP